MNKNGKPYAVLINMDYLTGLQTARILADNGVPVIEVSALLGDGVDQLKMLISETSIGKLPETDLSIVPNLRQHNTIKKAFSAVLNAKSGIDNELEAEL